MGRNSASFEIGGEIVLVDCGVLFPEDRHPGVDLILPALGLLSDRLDDIRALVLTHGHEDHIGAVPYLLKQRTDIPVYGSKLTLALVASKLKEHRIRGYRLIEVKEGERHQAGAFARLADEGVDLFMPDSTNAETPGFTPLEKDIEPSIARVFDQAEKKLIVACFASHVHRVQQVLNLAVKHGRKVAYVGRSMVRNMTTARDLGYLHVPANVLIEMKDIDKYRDDQVVIISTGSQGEPLAALSRIANREHPVIELGPGDVVLLASSLIPGNENSVYRVINGLTKLGAQVVHKGNAFVHVSGHASAGELLYCYNILRPRNVMPVHGEIRHLIANAKLAISTGVPAENTVVCEDGDVVDLADGRASKVGRVDASYVFVDGSTVGDITDSISDRLILGEEGFISVVAAVSLHTRSVIGDLDINARGFAEEPSVFDAVREQIREDLQRALDDGVDDIYRLQQVIRRTIGAWVSRRLRRRPMIVPVVVAT